MTYQQAIQIAKEQLEAKHIYSGFAFNYMLELTQLQDLNLYLIKDEEVPTSLLEVYQQGVIRLLNDEPLAYVLGFEWFYGRRFKVNQDVLIPRQETEELISNVIMDMDELFEDHCVIADVGTGSGNCAITLALETNSQVIATDISFEALEVAKENNKLLESNITFFQGDMGQPLIDNKFKVDVLVCNPPYILEDEEVQSSVLTYEPHSALFGGQDGLKYYRQILDEAKFFLNDKAMMAFEMGFSQQDNLRKEILKRYPHAKVSFKQDISGKDRMCFVYLNTVY